jgi:translation initiation factor 2 alpha subunit (eIF-2alpha)
MTEVTAVAVEPPSVAAKIHKVLVPRYRVTCDRCDLSESCSTLDEAIQLASGHDDFHCEQDALRP